MKIIEVRLGAIEQRELKAWERCATTSVDGDVYTLPWWARAVSRAYGLEGQVLFASSIREHGASGGNISGEDSACEGPSFARECDQVSGALALVRVRHWLFGDSLVSMPFCDSGGGLVGEFGAGMALVARARAIAEELGVPTLDVRRQSPFMSFGGTSDEADAEHFTDDGLEERGRWRVDDGAMNCRVRMVLSLPDAPDALMRSFKSKLRSQIQRPLKEGLKVRTGGLELVDEFYSVFVENMRDLGSPVHSRRFVEAVVSEYGKAATVFIVERNGVAVAGSVTLGFKGVLSNPWASSLRRYSQLAPNMLLYWSMLEYACENGYRTFDFGRSTVGEGTYRFKEQWGARPEPLYWYRFTRTDGKARTVRREGGGVSRAVEIWKRLPLPVTRVLGPHIRRHISL